MGERKLTTDERLMLVQIRDEVEGAISLRSPVFNSLCRSGLVAVREDGDYEKHIRITPAGRSALEASNG